MTRQAFQNAITVLMALGGSTNAVVHLVAMAGRLGIRIPLEEFDRISRRTPWIVNVKPSGEHLMEDLFEAGGVPVVMREILPLLDAACLTVTGQVDRRECRLGRMFSRDVVKPLDQPLATEGGIAILGGNIAPDGAVIKQTAASDGSCAIGDRPTSSRTGIRCTPRSIATICRWTRTQFW